MDTIKKYGKNYAQLVCTKQEEGGMKYLIYKRSIEPFLGCSGFPSGKVDWGEKVLEAASRELMEETGLSGDPKIKAIIHYLFDNELGEIIQDEYMYICHFDEPTGNLISSEEGENTWVLESEIPNALQKPFVPIENYLRIIEIIKENSPEIKFFEISSRTKDF